MAEPVNKKATVELYQCEIKVRWGDMDAMGHVNNTGYFRFCEQARMEWYSTLDRTTFENPQSQIVIINAFCEFRRPIVYPATLQVTLSAGEAGNSSFMSYYEISSVDHPEQGSYASATARVVWVDEAGTKSVPMPGSIRALLGSA